MVTRTLYISGTSGVMAIAQAGTNVDAISNPIPYASQLYYHSALPYVQIKQRIYVGGVYFGPQDRGVVTWEDGSKCKIICTKLYELGLMSEKIYLADQAFGEKLIQTNPDIYNGYRAWAEIVVDWMDGKGPKMMPWMTDEEFGQAAKKWSIKWAQDIATPWAEEMAYQMKESLLPNNTGKAIMIIGTPICKIVGVWQRIFGPSTKPAGFIKGAMLIPVFVLLKLVADLGKLIEGV